MNWLAVLPLGTMVVLGAIAAWTDLAARRIHNWLAAITLVAGLAFTFHHGGAASIGNHALHLLIALAVGMGLFAAGAIGGGDAKFYAAVAAWFNLSQAWLLFFLVSSWGLVLLVFWFVIRRAQGKPIRRQGGGMEGVPYGIAIAAGSITLISLGFGP